LLGYFLTIKAKKVEEMVSAMHQNK